MRGSPPRPSPPRAATACSTTTTACCARAAPGRAAAHAASPSGPPTRTAADLRDNASASSGSDDDSDGEADGVVVAGSPVDADTAGPGDAVAVRFNSRRGSVKAYGGVVVRIMARTIRVKFRDCAGYETYDVKTERVLTVAPYRSPREYPRLHARASRIADPPARARSAALPCLSGPAMGTAPCGLQRGFGSAAGGKRPPTLAAVMPAWRHFPPGREGLSH